MHKLILATLLGSLALTAQTRKISAAELRDRIAGAWAGQMIGVSYGAPTEFKSNGKIIEGDLPPWNDKRVENAIYQDDLYVDMTFSKVLDEKGINATTADFGNAFRNTKYELWHANLAARRMLNRGVPPEKTGLPEYNAHANDIDFQIESDFAGIIAPGLPRSGVEIAYRAGRVMNAGDGILGGFFVTCMYSAAFFEKDPVKVVEAGLACMPAGTPYHSIIKETLDSYRKNPKDWKATWQMLQDKWDRDDPCPDGALRAFNIDAKLNGAYIALGLLFGDGDFFRTVDISTRAGQDSDCNPANAAGVIGVMKGYSGIPEEWKRGIPAIANTKFSYTDYTFETIVESSFQQARQLILARGGKEQNGVFEIKTETPAAKQVPMWSDYGRVLKAIETSDAAWRFEGDWTEEKKKMIASTSDTEATVRFEGTGFILVGDYLPDGGKYELHVDGAIMAVLDANSDAKGSRGGEDYGHHFSLQPGKHEVKLRVLGKPLEGRQGTRVSLSRLVVFQR